MANYPTTLMQWAKSHHRLVVAFVVLFIIGLVIADSSWRLSEPTNLPVPEASMASTTVSDASEQLLADVVPAAIRIPAVNIVADFEEPLGLNADQTIEVPDSFETVGWYKYGPVPGELGPAVVLGHVDSFEGPAVFWALGQLEPGDLIEIERTDGEVVVFAVESLERHEQSGFPTRKVYSDLDYPGLRLITCTGVYSHDTLRYSHNLIVFAREV